MEEDTTTTEPEKDQPATDVAMIGNKPVEALRGAVATALTKMSAQGSVPAATAVLKLLDQVEAAHVAGEHQRKMRALRNKPLELAFYLGRLGIQGERLTLAFGRKLKPPEEAQHKAGINERIVEIHAVELGAALRGQKPTTLEWMQR